MSIILFKTIQRALLVSEFKREEWNEPYFIAPLRDCFYRDNRLYHDRFTGNHTHVFLIDDLDIVWYKIPSKDNIWKPLFWEGYLSSKAKCVLADGANLIIIDDLGKIHYRKTITEKQNKSHKDYQWKDKIEKSNYWRPGWAIAFFPLDHYSFRLKIDYKNPNISCCISHRGIWNNYILNNKGQAFYEQAIMGGTTTLFYYDGGENIKVADPMSILGFMFFVDIPLKLKRAYIESSASLLVYFGSDTKIWRFWWKMVDYDILGKVPHVMYYLESCTKWQELSSLEIPTSAIFKGKKIYNFGNNNRRLRVWFLDETNNTIIKCKMYIPYGKWIIENILF